MLRFGEIKNSRFRRAEERTKVESTESERARARIKMTVGTRRYIYKSTDKVDMKQFNH